MALVSVTGGPHGSPVTSPDERGGVKRYRVKVNGVTTTLRLSDADAAARGLTPLADETEVTAPAKPVPTKARTPANKSRKPANKRREAAAEAFRAKADDE